jgi:hypothetical protein
MKILLGDFSAKVGRLAVREESLHEINNDNLVIVVHFATSKNLIVKSTKFPLHNIHKHMWTPDGKMHSQIDDVVTSK